MIQSFRAKLTLCVLLAATSLTTSHAADNFATALAKDCFVIKDDKLEKIPLDSFKDAKLYVVYYSHLHCGSCVAVTKKLNDWFEKNKNRKEISLVFATRGENDNKELLTYVKKSKILFPTLDTKHYMSYVDGEGDDHAFYNDADDGVPRFRFFQADGTEIHPGKHGATDIYKVSPEQLDGITASILKPEKS